MKTETDNTAKEGATRRCPSGRQTNAPLHEPEGVSIAEDDNAGVASDVRRREFFGPPMPTTRGHWTAGEKGTSRVAGRARSRARPRRTTLLPTPLGRREPRQLADHAPARQQCRTTAARPPGSRESAPACSSVPSSSPCEGRAACVGLTH